MKKPRYCWVVCALSPRDGGWVRWFEHFREQETAWEAVCWFWDLAVDAGDYDTIKVVRTIKF